jgi:ABC-2 type transport system ATP-binding protein
MDEAAIQVERLSKTYSEGLIFRKRREALREVTFEVRRGEIFGLLGGNGAGKTTFIKILLGIIRRSQGVATILGYPAGDLRARRRVGYLPENLRVPRHLTALTALEYYGHLSNVPSHVIRERRGPLLEKVGLAPRASDPVRNYSKGMLQRLGLAQAMLHDPEIFILDEPTDGLDPLARSQVRSYLAELKQQGKTIFLNSHILQEDELICDRVAILDRGNLRRVADVREITSIGNGKELAAGNQLLEVQIDMSGDETALREALPKDALINWQPLPPEGFRAQLRLFDQSAVDQLIDELRRRGASIVGLARRKVSLEEAYLEIVAAEPIGS